MSASRNVNAYDATSIALHWIGAIAIFALFFTHEGERGSAAYAFHVGAGALISPALLWRFSRRFRRGTAKKPQQAEAFNLLAHAVLWGMLVAILLCVITGYLVPWSLGQSLEVFGFAIPSPLPRFGWLHEATEEIHELSGQAILPLVLLHVIGVAKHFLTDADRLAVLRRMVRPAADGL